jgi:hypothetical protein
MFNAVRNGHAEVGRLRRKRRRPGVMPRSFTHQCMSFPILSSTMRTPTQRGDVLSLQQNAASNPCGRPCHQGGPTGFSSGRTGAGLHRRPRRSGRGGADARGTRPTDLLGPARQGQLVGGGERRSSGRNIRPHPCATHTSSKRAAAYRRAPPTLCAALRGARRPAARIPRGARCARRDPQGR